MPRLLVLSLAAACAAILEAVTPVAIASPTIRTVYVTVVGDDGKPVADSWEQDRGGRSCCPWSDAFVPVIAAWMAWLE